MKKQPSAQSGQEPGTTGVRPIPFNRRQSAGVAEEEPCYVISVAARLLGVHAQTLRYYEKEGLVEPSRSRGNIRLYSVRDIERVRLVKRLVDDLGVNLAGVEVILNMSERMTALELELCALREETARLRTFGGDRAP